MRMKLTWKCLMVVFVGASLVLAQLMISFSTMGELSVLRRERRARV